MRVDFIEDPPRARCDVTISPSRVIAVNCGYCEINFSASANDSAATQLLSNAGRTALKVDDDTFEAKEVVPIGVASASGTLPPRMSTSAVPESSDFKYESAETAP